MTRQDVLTTLGQLIAGRMREAPPSWSVDEADGGFVIQADGVCYDIEVWPSQAEHDIMGEILGAMSDGERAAFARDLDEAAEEAERDGPVPADELRRSLDDAIERGLAERARARRAAR